MTGPAVSASSLPTILLRLSQPRLLLPPFSFPPYGYRRWNTCGVFSRETQSKVASFQGYQWRRRKSFRLSGFRVRIIPVLGTIPAIFGQVMASYVLTELSGLHIQTEPVVNLDLDHYRTLHQRLIEHEEIVYGTSMEVQNKDAISEIKTRRCVGEKMTRERGEGVW